MSGRILAVFLAMLLMTIAGAAEPTRVVQAEEILKNISLGQPVKYDNVIVEGDLDLSGLNLTRVPVKLTEDEANWGLLEYEIVASSPIIISNSVINGIVNLNRTFFQNSVIFRGTVFKEPAFLMCSRFNQTADFQVARFEQSVVFLGSQFNQTADFYKVQFKQIASFYEVQFNQTSWTAPLIMDK